MHTGHYISGAGHLTLIGWVLLGGLFTSDPPPFEATEVSVISGAEYEAILAAQRAPDRATDVAQPEAPTVTPDVPDVVQTPDEVVQQPAPEQAQTPPQETAPDVAEQTPPPQAEVVDEAPTLDPVGDVAVQVPDVAPTAVPRPVERVAPQPVAQPDPDATPDDVQQEAVTQQETGETPQDTQEATAPEAATTEIVTEATAAPKASSRPPGRRPAAPVQQAAQTPAQDNSSATEDANAAAIAAAVAAAQAETPAAAAPTGPPLSSGEKENLRVAVSNCWNVDVGGRSANTVVTVAVSLDRNGKVIGNIEMIASEGGDAAAVRTAFGAARRAILRCQKSGYQLPAEKYEQWKVVEMTFNPEKMRVK